MTAPWDALVRSTAPEPPADLAEDSEVDWAQVCTLAASHGVTGHLGTSLSGSEVVPDAVRERVDAERREQTMRSLRLTDGLCGVLDRLRSASIRALPYKGPVLSVVAYGDPGVRDYVDVDLVVPPTEFERAREVLADAGFRTAERLRALGEVELVDDAGTVVDLHRSVLPRYFPHALEFAALWDRRTSVDVGAETVPALAPADRLLVLAVHGTKHRWYRLAWIRDVAAVVGHTTDWEAVRTRARALGCRRHVCLALWLASRLYGVDPPESAGALRDAGGVVGELGERIERDLRDGPAEPPDDAEQFRTQWLAFERVRDRVRFAGRVATIPSQADRESLALPPALSPVYRFVRPVRLLCGLGREAVQRCRRVITGR